MRLGKIEPRIVEWVGESGPQRIDHTRSVVRGERATGDREREHSLPLGTSFLSECAKPFVDEHVVAARCVYAGKAADARRWLNPEMLDISSDFISKGILASGCVIRRSAWQKVKFDEQLSAAEDKLWTREILNLGFTVISPVPAFYLYLKPMPASVNVRKNYREIVEVFLQTGKTVGFINTPFKTITKKSPISPIHGCS